MSVNYPFVLLLLLLVPLLIGAYLWMLRRRRPYSIRHSNLALIRQAISRKNRWQQHLPFGLFLVGLTSLITAAARPVVEVEVPLNRSTIILALDVSRSMCATDVDPNRLTVAQEAALAFVDDQEAGTQIGLVAFAGFAELIVPPTTDKDTLRSALENLTTSLGTAIGSATLKSIDAIAEINQEVAPSGVFLGNLNSIEGVGEFYHPEIIVLLTDGANSQGPPPLAVAERAAARHIRVYTIGFGTTDITDMVCTREQLGTDAFDDRFNGNGGFSGFGGGFGAGFRRFLVIDEPTLMGVAEATGGQYFRAENSDQLLEVFLNLPSQVVLQTERIELAIYLVIGGALLLIVGIYFSMRWHKFP